MFLRVTLVLSAVACCLGYPSGAPETACQHFTPRHPGGVLQETQSPFTIRPKSTSVRAGGSVQLTVAGPRGMQYEGFMIQARDQRDQPIGNFTVVPSNAKTVQCGNGSQNTVTHDSKAKKSSLNFAWKPPAGFVGSVVFKGTVLQDYATYWVGVESTPVQVARSG